MSGGIHKLRKKENYRKIVEHLIASRKHMVEGLTIHDKVAVEGGCGVIGAACTVPVKGKHFLTALTQMKNRGNGKGGGVAVLGLQPEKLGISAEILEQCYIIQIAYLDPTAKEEVETKFLNPNFDIYKGHWVEHIEDHKKIGLEVKPPEIYRYFCRVKPDVLQQFIKKHHLEGLSPEEAEDEFIFQNTYALNRAFYASLGEKRAFVLSHGKNMLVFKIVGYAHQVIQYYKLEEFTALVWIGHHRYPTKGTVWHPGGAHPFIGVHEALVHNGDFSNYHSVAEYLAQRNIFPLFLTDTEVAVYLFDLWRRVYRYPYEYVIEALAPTTERDFLMLDDTKKIIYRELQQTHIHGSPDGPWFFIIGATEPKDKKINLIGITDTSMLRPQVFALQEGEEKLGLVASERQAIDAFLRSLSAEDPRFYAKADIYWNARGGSYTDGGAFIFSIDYNKDHPTMRCTNKFGEEIKVPPKHEPHTILTDVFSKAFYNIELDPSISSLISQHTSIKDLLHTLKTYAEENHEQKKKAVHFLTQVLDRFHLTPFSKNGEIRALVEETLFTIFRSFPYIGDTPKNTVDWLRIDWSTRHHLRPPSKMEKSLLIDVSEFPPEGPESAALFIVKAYKMGWKHVFTFDWRGQRFCGCGLGPNSHGFRIDVYGNPGDYLASGLDGAEIYVHCSAQDQVAQIIKSGKLVIYGDVGQTFMYGAKGGEVYVLGNAAGRPLINAVGKPHVVINGTCLDYLAESFMAGNPLEGGGFVILNGLTTTENGDVVPQTTPYPGSNLFSLASGGAIYVRDPHRLLDTNQLNGGTFNAISDKDAELILKYLEENEKLFGINPLRLLTEKSNSTYPTIKNHYRKVEPISLDVLH